jgi:hypothetical protein
LETDPTVNFELVEEAALPATEISDDAGPEVALDEPMASELEAVPFVGKSRARLLEGAGIRSVSDLESAGVADIGMIKGVGMRNAQRIKQWLASRNGSGAAASGEVDAAGEDEEVLELSNVPHIGNYRAKVLAGAGIHTLSDLEAADAETIGSVKGVGFRNAQRIKDWLASRGEDGQDAEAAAPVRTRRRAGAAVSANGRGRAAGAPPSGRGRGRRGRNATPTDAAAPPATRRGPGRPKTVNVPPVDAETAADPATRRGRGRAKAVDVQPVLAEAAAPATRRGRGRAKAEAQPVLVDAAAPGTRGRRGRAKAEAQPALVDAAAPATRRGRGRAKAADVAVASPMEVTPIAPSAQIESTPVSTAQIMVAISQIKGRIADGALPARFAKQCERLADIAPAVEKASAKLGKKDRKRLARALGELTAAADAISLKKLTGKRQDRLFDQVKSSRQALSNLAGG